MESCLPTQNSEAPMFLIQNLKQPVSIEFWPTFPGPLPQGYSLPISMGNNYINDLSTYMDNLKIPEIQDFEAIIIFYHREHRGHRVNLKPQIIVIISSSCDLISRIQLNAKLLLSLVFSVFSVTSVV